MAISPKKKVTGGAGGQNIQVFVRCRPLNNTEKDARSYSVVDCPNSREVTVKEKQMSSLTKTFQFDKVFGAKSKQIEVYRSVVEPLILQVMQGYNCTVFAYGQTGTGKTFTMEGGDGREDPSVTWENDPTAGIIPRALAQLFDELRVQQDAEFTVRVSFLELYNEEIFDLLSANDDTTRLKLFEDPTRKGSVVVQGLEEALVQNKSEVYKILEKGSAKRKTAATLMNAHSSRSHTVFTVTVHMKESSVEGEEVLRCGKLNLVDLAGSENIGRSGAMDKRAREAGNINQSLLTLGRVITCLVDRVRHIPYRESKLTRLLQDSLGGRTKTSIIATISPAGINLEETLSTLDYAHRAKNITNKPEVNQKMSKSAKLKEYTEEIEKLRKDLIASREKNGVFIANDNYQNMLNQIEMGNQELAEKINSIKAMTEEMTKLETLFEEVNEELKEKETELNAVNSQLEETEETLEATKVVLRKTASDKEVQKHLVEKHVETESKLKDQAKMLMETADSSSKDLKHLHDKLDRMKLVDDENSLSKEEFNETFHIAVNDIVDNLDNYGNGHESECNSIQRQLCRQVERRVDSLTGIRETLKTLLKDQNSAADEHDVLRQHLASQEVEFLSSQSLQAKEFVSTQKEKFDKFESSQITPLLNQITLVLDQQVHELELMKSNLSEELKKLVASVNSFGTIVAKNILSLKSAVDKYADNNEQRLKSLTQKNEEIRASELNFKDLMDSLMQSYMVHSQLVTDHTSSLNELSKEELNQAQELVEKSSQVSEAINKIQEDTIDSIDKKQEDIKDLIMSSSIKCNNFNKEVNEVGKAVENVVKDHVKESVEAFENSSATSVRNFKSHEKSQADKISQFKEALAENSTNLNIVGEAVIEKLNEIQVKDNEGVEAIDERISEVCNNTKDIIVGIRSKVAEEQENVTSFLRTTLKQDVPSGLTPARIERSYPRYLAATSPHEKIISRFRAQAELQAAARLAHDDSGDDDSMISASSGSGSMSRHNSSSDVRKVTPDLSRSNSTENKRTPSVTRDTRGSSSSRTPSTSRDQVSRPGSRAGSRQNSSSELKSKFGSTSDIGSEIGDAENQDPNFRKPKAVTRELKKPEIKTKRLLLSSDNNANDKKTKV